MEKNGWHEVKSGRRSAKKQTPQEPELAPRQVVVFADAPAMRDELKKSREPNTGERDDLQQFASVSCGRDEILWETLHEWSCEDPPRVTGTMTVHLALDKLTMPRITLRSLGGGLCKLDQRRKMADLLRMWPDVHEADARSACDFVHAHEALLAFHLCTLTGGSFSGAKLRVCNVRFDLDVYGLVGGRTVVVQLHGPKHLKAYKKAKDATLRALAAQYGWVFVEVCTTIRYRERVRYLRRALVDAGCPLL